MTPIFDAVMDEFFPEHIEVDAQTWRMLVAFATLRGVTPELMAQDIVSDHARRVLAEAAP